MFWNNTNVTATKLPSGQERYSYLVDHGLALMLMRGVFIGITRDFGVARSQANWIVVACLL